MGEGRGGSRARRRGGGEIVTLDEGHLAAPIEVEDEPGVLAGITDDDAGVGIGGGEGDQGAGGGG